MIRRVLKWLGCVLSSLLLLAWLPSYWWTFAARASDSVSDAQLSCGRGVVKFYKGVSGDFPSTWPGHTILVVHVARGKDPGWRRNIDIGNIDPARMPWRNTSIHLSIPFVLLALSAAWLFICRRRSAPDRCPACSYDLKGLAPNSPCPECGKLA